jgi:diguanylate cyclase (GGDEF)-like protein
MIPALDYVQAVRSVYKDRRAMMFGAISSAIAAGAAGYKTASLVLFAHAVLFILAGLARYALMSAFQRARVGPEDADAAQVWEIRATVIGVVVAALYGSWCFSSVMFVDDGYAQLASISLSVAALVGIAARNFGLDRLLTLQALFLGTPMGLGLLLVGDIFHAILAALLIILLISFRSLAGDVREILFSAVHGRVDASRLALELDTALDTMHHGLCMLDESGLIAVANDPAVQVMAELVPGQWNGRPFAAMIAAAAARGAIPQRAADRLLEIINVLGSGKVVLHLADERFFEVTVSSRNERTVALFEDISARVKAEERINFMAHYDSLTGLPNRAYFSEQVEADLERRQVNQTPGTALLMIVDLDDFKHVNDTMGHLVGDRLLVDAAQRLRGALGRASVLARFGGDEFVVYRREGTTTESAYLDPERILEAFSAPFEVLDQQLLVNVSIGAVATTDYGDMLDALMTKADLALYKAKAGGKAQAQVFRDEMDTEYRYRQRLKGDLRACVEADGLTLAFQPLIDLKTRKLVACEALARWHQPVLCSIPPSLFIPIAEETGLITDISRWVLKSATAECRNWPDDVSVSINISARDFRSGDIPAMVAEALSASGLEPHRLELEVTETALIEERGAATSILSELARKGIGIALDDFGTGYSSLSYLQALPFTKLKIDRSFVMDITSNPRSLTLLSNVAQLGKDINLVVVAEGVETEEQLALITAHTRVDQIQGYLFGVPLPRREVAELIQRTGASAPVNLPAGRRRG